MANYVHIVYQPTPQDNDQCFMQDIDQCFNNFNEARKYAMHIYGNEQTIVTHRLWDEFQVINEDEDSDILYGVK